VRAIAGDGSARRAPRRRRVVTASLATLALAASACFSGPPPQPSTAPATPPPTPTTGRVKIEASGSIVIFGLAGEKGDAVERGRVDAFRAEYPEVGLRFGQGAFDPDDFLAAMLSADPPDVVRIPRDRLGSYVARGILEPLDDCLGQVHANTTDFRDQAVRQVTIDGKVYGLPEFFWVTDWLIDDDLFAKAGLKAASWNGTDWDGILATRRALRSRTKARVGIDSRAWVTDGSFPLWVAAAGGRMLSDDGKESLLDTPEVAQALTLVKSLSDAEGGLDAIRSKLGKKGIAGNMFSADIEGAFPGEQSYLATLASLGPKTRFSARPFTTRKGRKVSYEEGDALAILANSDNKDAACAFVTTMTATDAWIAGAQAARKEAQAKKRIFAGVATGNIAADDAILSSLVDLRGQRTFRRAIGVYRASFDSAVGMPPSPSAEEFRQAWIDAVDKVLAGDADVASALRQAEQDAQDAIDSAAP
jgi:multiple sugar transport system substrate-binding protein